MALALHTQISDTEMVAHEHWARDASSRVVDDLREHVDIVEHAGRIIDAHDEEESSPLVRSSPNHLDEGLGFAGSDFGDADDHVAS